jgi:hypothetical protein
MHCDEFTSRTQCRRDTPTDYRQAGCVEVTADFAENHQIEWTVGHLVAKILAFDFDLAKTGAPLHRTARGRERDLGRQHLVAERREQRRELADATPRFERTPISTLAQNAEGRGITPSFLPREFEIPRVDKFTEQGGSLSVGHLAGDFQLCLATVHTGCLVALGVSLCAFFVPALSLGSSGFR